MTTNKNSKILVVEDDVDIREALDDLLTSEGYSVTTAGDGQEALTYLAGATDLPNMILLDLMMPVKDGFQFLAEQSKDSKISNIRVVIMTADSQVESKRDRLGDRTILRKPVDLDAVLNVVQKVLP